jgi:hypothetical protein
MPIGMPGWPDFAFSTASMARKRIAFAISACETRLGGDTGQSGFGHSMRLLRSISCRISGVRMSCIARSSFDPWITIELARDMKLFGIIDSK